MTVEVVVAPPAGRNDDHITTAPVQAQLDTLRPMTGEQQAQHVTAMLSHSRTGLLAAIAAQNLPGIVEFKAKAAAVQEIAKQLQLSRDLQDDATEFVRRAERGLGVAIREGQARGEIIARGKNPNPNRKEPDVIGFNDPRPVTDFAPDGELTGNGGGIYAMTDGVTDEQFEAALDEARREGNLSRANVARKARALAQPAEPSSGTETADDQLQPTAHSDERTGFAQRHAALLSEAPEGLLSTAERDLLVSIVFTAAAAARGVIPITPAIRAQMLHAAVDAITAEALVE